MPTDEQRAKVRSLAQAHSEHSDKFIARQLGISRDTLHRHFADEMELGRAELAAAAGAQLISLALKGEDAVGADGKLLAPGNLDALKFLLARRCGWSTRIEHTGRNGRPIEVVDLSRLSFEQLQEYGRLAAIAEGLDPEEVVGPDASDA